MFKVCYTVDAPYAGGAERYVSLIAGCLDRSLFEPFVLMKRNRDLEGWRHQVEKNDVRVLDVEMDLPFQPHHAIGICRALHRIGPHIVHINMPGPYDGQMGLLAPLARLSGASAILVTEHLPMVERLWKRALVKEISYRWVDRILTVCHANLPYLHDRQRVHPRKTAVIYNALPRDFGKRGRRDREAARRQLNLPDDSLGIVMVGALKKRKGLTVLINALATLQDLSWRLIVVGDGEERASSEQLAAGLGLEQRVRFLGAIPEEEVEKILCAVDLLALPSFVEGMPYVILEAMACELPVVASRINGVPEAAVEGETARLVPPGDVESLGAALRELINDSELRYRFGRNARARFEKYFTLDTQVEAIQSTYLEILGVTRSEGVSIGNEAAS